MVNNIHNVQIMDYISKRLQTSPKPFVKTMKSMD
jgi:hypothetical protein